jgi:hypothetical protein
MQYGCREDPERHHDPMLRMLEELDHSAEDILPIDDE